MAALPKTTSTGLEKPQVAVPVTTECAVTSGAFNPGASSAPGSLPDKTQTETVETSVRTETGWPHFDVDGLQLRDQEPCVKGGVKPDHWGGVKVGQLSM